MGFYIFESEALVKNFLSWLTIVILLVVVFALLLALKPAIELGAVLVVLTVLLLAGAFGCFVGGVLGYAAKSYRVKGLIIIELLGVVQLLGFIWMIKNIVGK